VIVETDDGLTVYDDNIAGKLQVEAGRNGWQLSAVTAA
jgi:hypothetical protein